MMTLSDLALFTMIVNKKRRELGFTKIGKREMELIVREYEEFTRWISSN